MRISKESSFILGIYKCVLSAIIQLIEVISISNNDLLRLLTQQYLLDSRHEIFHKNLIY